MRERVESWSRRLVAVASGLAAAGLVAACTSALPTPTSADAARQNTTVEQLSAGRERYALKCSGCHDLLLPSMHTAAEWPLRVDEMADDAHLDAEDRELIVRYLVAFARQDGRAAASGSASSR
jgi:cytochrome c5